MSITTKQIESQALNVEVEKFLKAGGVIQTLPRGYSGESHNLIIGKKMRSIMAASVASAHARNNKPNVIARNEAREKGLKHYHGEPCRACGSTLKYTSTASCFSCNKASALRRSERMRKERHA